jgi:hypothetical protein
MPDTQHFSPTAKKQSGQDENLYIAEKLAEVASLLEQQNASRFRVNAYWEAAAFVAAADTPMRVVYDQDGRRALINLPTIGASIAAAIAELLDTGDLEIIDRLRGSLDPERLFLSVPMIGPRLAQAIHEQLGIDTLEGLEAAAFDGRLETIKGVGPRRTRSIQHSLAEILARRRPRAVRQEMPPPPISDVLQIDREYRDLAAQGKLPLMTPRRFNPAGAARIPVLHAEREPWRFTALFSNTPNAHRLGRTRDWVVIYYEQDGQAEGQCTVVTEHSGKMTGKRVIRGYETACSKLSPDMGQHHPDDK